MSDRAGYLERDLAACHGILIVGVIDSGDNRLEEITNGRGGGGAGECADEAIHRLAVVKGGEHIVLGRGCGIIEVDGYRTFKESYSVFKTTADSFESSIESHNAEYLKTQIDACRSLIGDIEGFRRAGEGVALLTLEPGIGCTARSTQIEFSCVTFIHCFRLFEI